MVHKATKSSEILLAGYISALWPEDFYHLVLSERLARDAALSVAQYLRAESTAKPVFSLLHNDETIKFARLHASQRMQHLWDCEKAAAQEREDKLWQEVLEKKARVRGLDAELARFEGELRSARSDLSRTSAPARHTTDQNNREYHAATIWVNAVTANVSSTQARILSEERPPTSIFQPLPSPEHPEFAFPVLFFLFMPADFRVLSRLSFAAQQMLLPREQVVQLPSGREVDVESQIEEADAKTRWLSYYTVESTDSFYLSEPTKLRLRSAYAVPKSSAFTPPDVRSFTQRRGQARAADADARPPRVVASRQPRRRRPEHVLRGRVRGCRHGEIPLPARGIHPQGHVSHPSPPPFALRRLRHAPRGQRGAAAHTA